MTDDRAPAEGTVFQSDQIALVTSDDRLRRLSDGFLSTYVRCP
ncbi:MAG: hypothetical protein AAF557_02320 [Pseudomonadota bacterium]